MFAENGHLVHERDAGGEHAVGGVFGQLSRLPIHREERFLALHERIVQAPHHAERLGRLAADDDAIGIQTVLNGRAFLEELRIGNDLHVCLGLLLEEVVELTIRPGGNGRFHDDRHHVIVVLLGERITDLFASAFQIAHVDGAIGFGRRADAKEDDLGILDGGADVFGELNLARGVVLLHQFLQARFENGAVTILQRLELSSVFLDTADGVSDARQANACHQTDVATTDDRYIHFLVLNTG